MPHVSDVHTCIVMHLYAVYIMSHKIIKTVPLSFWILSNVLGVVEISTLFCWNFICFTAVKIFKIR